MFSSQFLSSCAVRENSDEEGSDTEPVNNSRPFEPAFEIVGTSTVSTDQERQQWTFPINLYCVSLPNKRFYYYFFKINILFKAESLNVHDVTTCGVLMVSESSYFADLPSN